jgi:polyhydroxybutyrate depolymerase
VSTRARATITALTLGVVLAACTSTSGSDAASPSPSPSSLGTGNRSVAGTTVAPPRGSAGCGQDPPVPATTGSTGDVVRAFTQGSTQRSYRLAVPTSYDKSRPAPLVLNLHGSGGSAEQHSKNTDLPARAAKRGVLSVAPDAVATQWELTAEGADRDFLDAIVDNIERTYCVDLDRVHVMGLSLGAWKAALTACVQPDRFASAALVTVEVHPPNCPPMPVVAFHGTADRVVPYGEGADPGVVNIAPGNANLPGARSNIASWATSAGCAAQPQESRLGDDVVRWVYGDCDPGLDVELYTIVHGDHTWPGADGPPPLTTQTIDATELALDWFAAHPRRRP